MKKLHYIIIFSLILTAVFCGCHQRTAKPADDKERFHSELQTVLLQQTPIREQQILQTMRLENGKAQTLSNIAELELLMDNYELSQAEKDKALLKYFNNAQLYMQILLMPDCKKELIHNRIKNEILFELSSVLLRSTVARMMLNNMDMTQKNAADLRKSWNNALENCKIEYDALRINDFNAGEKLPDIYYPMHFELPPLSIDEYRYQQKYGTPVREEAKKIYAQLQEKFKENMPLSLLRLLFIAPHAVNDLYGNDLTLKQDVAMMLSELAWIYRSSQFFADMQSTFVITNEFQQAVKKEKNPSVEMLDGCYKSIIAYELACLKMFTETGLTPFDQWRLPEDDLPALEPQRMEAVKLLISDLLKKL